MTIEESKGYLQTLANRIPLKFFTDDGEKVYDDFCKTTLESLEKQTPKKLVSLRKFKKFDGYTMGRCPCCNEHLDDSFIENMKYCYICGQAIDWNEEEDEYEDDCPYI